MPSAHSAPGKAGGKVVAQPPKGEAPEWCRNRMVSTLFVPLLFFHLYPIKIAFSQKFRFPVGIFLLFRKISCIQKISDTKKDRRADLFPFHSSQKLLIRPMLMRGRAQAFCFDESARSSRRSGISVSSGKSRYSHSCHQDF